MHLLLAACDLQDVAVMGRIARWPKIPGRYGVHVERKWFITFAWEDVVGAIEIRLERH